MSINLNESLFQVWCKQWTLHSLPSIGPCNCFWQTQKTSSVTSSCLLIHWTYSDVLSSALKITFWLLMSFQTTVGLVLTTGSSPDIVLKTTSSRGLRYVLSFTPTSNSQISVPWPINQWTTPWSHIWKNYSYGKREESIWLPKLLGGMVWCCYWLKLHSFQAGLFGCD